MTKHSPICHSLVAISLCLTLCSCASSKAHKLVQKGDEAWVRGLRDTAIAYYSEALEVDPGNTIALFTLGMGNMARKDYYQAKKYLKKIVERRRQKEWILSVAWAAMGRVYFETRQYQQMHDAFEKAHEYTKRNSYVFYPQLAGALECLGQNERAEEIYAQATEHYPQYQVKRYRIDFAVACGNYGLAKKLSTDILSLGIDLEIPHRENLVQTWFVRKSDLMNDERAIRYLWRDGFADLAGLQVGDIITELNGTSMSGVEIDNALRSSKYGSTINLTVVRDTVSFPLEIVLDYDYYLSRKDN